MNKVVRDHALLVLIGLLMTISVSANVSFHPDEDGFDVNSENESSDSLEKQIQRLSKQVEQIAQRLERQQLDSDELYTVKELLRVSGNTINELVRLGPIVAKLALPAFPIKLVTDWSFRKSFMASVLLQYLHVFAREVVKEKEKRAQSEETQSRDVQVHQELEVLTEALKKSTISFFLRL